MTTKHAIMSAREYFKKINTFDTVEETENYPLEYLTNIVPVTEINRILYDPSIKFIDFAKTNGSVFTTVLIGHYLFIVTMKDAINKLLTIKPFVFVKSTKTFYQMYFIYTISSTIKTTTMYSPRMNIKLSDIDNFFRNIDDNSLVMLFTSYLPESATTVDELKYDIYRK